jgi:hypothetical protein
MPDTTQGRSFGLSALAAAYLFFLLLSASSYGDPFPFMGRFYPGRAGEALVFADSMISLYLLIGILKRQRLTVWLIIGYNLLDICNACVNLALIPPGHYLGLTDTPIPQDEVLLNTLAAGILLMLLNLYVFRNRRHFTNRSCYLF